ncbi:hypothetical protein J4771_02405 [Candidatus Kaistella beijingensis]|uniref:glycoside hydrolase family 55 protein n=1 Tax=Candidatus Kaistella beijingensis TaxID=2820270 RepID=UPI001CC651C3|nr:glycoside hydrolase family 55 protein [Candidatus Kaistella beijingensis]UBB90228.1 hypothetical protein J4771_02405 [Candidatus Kaistella beijingensis]
MKKLFLLNLLIVGFFGDGQISLVNPYTKQSNNYLSISKDYDGNSLLDSNVDNAVIYKKNDSYYAVDSYVNGEALNVRIFGAIPNDGKDDTMALKKALKYSSIVIPAGVYEISDKLIISKSISILGLGPVDINLKDKVNKGMILIKNAFNVRIENINFWGNRSGQVFSNTNPLDLSENRSIIRVERSEKITIKDCVFEESEGDGISLDNDFSFEAQKSNVNSDIIIDGNQFISNGRNGVSVIHAKNVVIKNSKFYNHIAQNSMLGCGIDIEPNPGLSSNENYYIENVNIENNYLENNNEGIQIFRILGTVGSGGAIKNVNILNNNFKNNLHNDLIVWSLSDTSVNIVGNNFDSLEKTINPYYSAIAVVNCDTALNVENNTITAARPFVFTNVKSASIVGNRCFFTNYGILIKNDNFYQSAINSELNKFEKNIFSLLSSSETEIVFVKMITDNLSTSIKKNFFIENIFNSNSVSFNQFAFIFSNVPNGIINSNYFLRNVLNMPTVNSNYVHVNTDSAQKIVDGEIKLN